MLQLSAICMAFLHPAKIPTRYQSNIAADQLVMATAHDTAPSISCEATVKQEVRVDASAVREALHNVLCDTKLGDDGRSNLSQSFIEGLLLDSSSSGDQPAMDGGERTKNDTGHEPLYKPLRGLPERPLYLEIARRLSAMNAYKNRWPGAAGEHYFLPAAHFGVTEMQSMSSLIPEPPLDTTSVDECTAWLQNLEDESNILALLGLRRTIGTASKCFVTSLGDSGCNATKKQCLLPPSRLKLLEASRAINKPNSKSGLTKAARALAKHAHRGAAGFFGAVSGGDAEKNKHADEVVARLIDEAAWINIHAFGGIDEARPVVEVRSEEGYGARWSAVWEKDAFSPEDIRFRGFLEPNMEGGHEQGWRH